MSAKCVIILDVPYGGGILIAKTLEEKESIKVIRTKYDDYHRKLSDDELLLATFNVFATTAL